MIRDTIEKYKQLQELDTRLKDVNTKLAAIPVLLKDSLEELEIALNEEKTVTDELKSCQDELNKLNANIETQKGLLTNAQQKLSSVKNSKEYQAALKELDALKKKLATDMGKSETFVKNISELHTLFEERTSNAKRLADVYNEKKEVLEEENSHLYAEKNELESERNSYTAEIRKPILSRYEKVLNARGNLAIVQMVDGVCRGCFMKLTPQMVVNVKKENEIYQCPFCQRFLYYVESEPVQEDDKTKAKIKKNKKQTDSEEDI